MLWSLRKVTERILRALAGPQGNGGGRENGFTTFAGFVGIFAAELNLGPWHFLHGDRRRRWGRLYPALRPRRAGSATG